jgi:hypothetical protein
LTPIIQNELVKVISKEIDFGSFDAGFSDQQLLFLEIHMQIDGLREELIKSHDVHIGKTIEDSEAICKIKRTKRILQENDKFDILKYLYHLEHLEESNKALMNLNVETNHPAFDVMTRAHIEIPEC